MNQIIHQKIKTKNKSINSKNKQRKKRVAQGFPERHNRQYYIIKFTILLK